MTTQKLQPYLPLDQQATVERKQVAKYFNRIGRGVNCRMDVPVLVMSDVKWAAKVFSELAIELTNLGWEDERNDIWKIVAARTAFEKARFELSKSNRKEEATKEWRKAITFNKNGYR